MLKDINYCTRCHRSLDNLWCEVTLTSKVIRKREDDSLENVENSNFLSTEILCIDCFNKFCDTIENEMASEDTLTKVNCEVTDKNV